MSEDTQASKAVSASMRRRSAVRGEENLEPLPTRLRTSTGGIRTRHKAKGPTPAFSLRFPCVSRKTLVRSHGIVGWAGREEEACG